MCSFFYFITSVIMTTYSEKLQHPLWQKKRLQILKRDKFACQLCNDKETTLHIHHTVYRNCNVWEYDDSELITYCKHCHAAVEFSKEIQERYSIHRIFKFIAKDKTDVIMVLILVCNTNKDYMCCYNLKYTCESKEITEMPFLLSSMVHQVSSAIKKLKPHG